MSELNKIILDMIRCRKTIKEISQSLLMSEKQIYMRIKQIINYGYKLNPTYYYSSDILYSLDDATQENGVRIKMPRDSNFRCIAISDIHIGNVNSNIYYLKMVYEYASKNNISVILNCGDLIEGVISNSKRNIDDLYEQIETLIKKYPYDKNINNFVIFGNHDFHSLYYNKLDMSKRISNARYDMIPIGYGKGIVNLKSDSILLEHDLSIVENPNIGQNCKISLIGHGHMMKTKYYDKLYISVPTLSNVSPDRTIDVIPGFLDLEIQFEKIYFKNIKIKHMIIDNKKIYQASEDKCIVKELVKKI